MQRTIDVFCGGFHIPNILLVSFFQKVRDFFIYTFFSWVFLFIIFLVYPFSCSYVSCSYSFPNIDFLPPQISGHLHYFSMCGKCLVVVSFPCCPCDCCFVGTFQPVGCRRGLWVCFAAPCVPVAATSRASSPLLKIFPGSFSFIKTVHIFPSLKFRHFIPP